MQATTQLETAVLANGCFWCSEAVFSGLKGVKGVVPGYTGGTIGTPSYEEVSSGNTGHAEAIKIDFDPTEISYSDLLTVFFYTHDPTTPGRQGNDIGTQYRSAIFYATPTQRQEAQKFIQDLDEHKAYEKPIVTELQLLKEFYAAEDYHKNYYSTHSDAPYCELVIAPKIEKLQKRFSQLLKQP